MQWKLKLLARRTQLRQKSLGVPLMLKAGEDIVGMAHVDEVTACLAVPPSLGPHVEAVQQIYVGK